MQKKFIGLTESLSEKKHKKKENIPIKTVSFNIYRSYSTTLETSLKIAHNPKQNSAFATKSTKLKPTKHSQTNQFFP